MGHDGTKSGQTGAKMGQVGAQIDQDDPKIGQDGPKIGQDGPKIGQDGANFEDSFEFWIFCKILTNIKKTSFFNAFLAKLASRLHEKPTFWTIDLSMVKLRGLVMFGVPRVWKFTSVTRWSQDDAR